MTADSFPGERLIMDAHKIHTSLPDDRYAVYAGAIVATEHALTEAVERGEYGSEAVKDRIDEFMLAILRVQGETEELRKLGEI